LYEAAVAHHRATGKTALLEVATANADLVDAVFGPGALRGAPGHQEIELALIALWRETGQPRYLELARYFLDDRGRLGVIGGLTGYNQWHQPPVDQRAATGHAVRGLYMYLAMTNLAAVRPESGYRAAADALWNDVAAGKLYVTGGVGARPYDESFGSACELPNRDAYCETCGSIAMVQWSQRMFRLDPDARYIDVLERSLYNGVLSGYGLSGDRFFYPNPLSIMGPEARPGGDQRFLWHPVPCCPTSLARFIPAVPGLLYGLRERTLYVNLYAASSATLHLAGVPVALTQTTDYPWSGRVTLDVSPGAPATFEIRLRIPGWAREEASPGNLYRFSDTPAPPPSLTLNGVPAAMTLDRGYAVLARSWHAGDRIELDLPMPVRRLAAREEARDCRDRVALQRGPVVYCAEAADNNGHTRNLMVGHDASFAAIHEAGLLGGVTSLSAKAQAMEPGRAGKPGVWRQVTIKAIPYAVRGYRGTGEMDVWLPDKPLYVRDRSEPSRAARAVPSASFAPPDFSAVEALNDQFDPAGSSDMSIPRHTFWPHQGTAEWLQYDFAGPVDVASVEVFWFDDSGMGGGCKVPAAWSVQYRGGGGVWLPVAGASLATVDKNRFNSVIFDPVRTDGLRLAIQWAAGYSGGVLEWRADGLEMPPAAAATASASFVAEGNTPAAVNDRIEPADSSDLHVPRLTFWPRSGTEEWVQLDLRAAAAVEGVEVFWFDDQGRGGCRVPASWRVLYRDGAQWRPVEHPSDYSRAVNRYNCVRFDPVRTGALRLEIQLQPGQSAGVLEWRVALAAGPS
jgi:DUF1680 family protein